MSPTMGCLIGSVLGWLIYEQIGLTGFLLLALFRIVMLMNETGDEQP